MNPQQECIADKVPAATHFVAYVDDEVADERDVKYGYSGLDQVVDEDEDAFGSENGEGVTNESKQDLRPRETWVSYAQGRC
jgi:hypothetical protein